MKTLILNSLFFIAVQSQAFMCGGDQVLSHTIETQTQICYQAGYCTMYDFNPENGRYENYYGFHNRCSGTQDQQIQKYLCQREDKTTYEDDTEGPWSACHLTPW